MSEVINVAGHETPQLSDEAVAYAEEQVIRIRASLDEELPITGARVNDVVNKELRDYDRAIQAQLDKFGFQYFGHTLSIDQYLYDSLRTGYDPNPIQEAQCEEEGADFLWEEILELHSEHPDIDRIISGYGYDCDKTPVSMPFPGAHALPCQTLKDILGTMFDRGREYKQWGWGFPWYSDGIPTYDENEIVPEATILNESEEGDN